MSVEQESLSEIVPNSFGGSRPPKAEPAAKGEPAKPAEAAPPAAKEPEAKAETAEAKPDRSRDESGRFTKAEEKPAEKPQLSAREIAGIIDERKKRQALEQELATLRQQQQQPPKAPPSVFENEDAAIQSRIDEALRPMRERFFNQSIRSAQSRYGDAFAGAYEAFAQASERDARLIASLQDADDPGEYIYMHGMFHKELAGVGGDLMKYREHVTADLSGKLGEKDKQIAALTAELEAMKKAQADLENVPRSLNNTSSGAAPKSGEGDEDDLRAIARFNQRR